MPSATPTSWPPSWTRPSTAAEPGTVAAFVAEPIVGATLAAAVPPEGYWPGDRGGLPPSRRAPRRRRGHDGLRADGSLVRRSITGASGPTSSSAPRAARPATSRSGSWPRRASVHETVVGEPPGFVHGFTYSHHAVGAAVAGEVLRILEDERLVEASATKGERLQSLLRERLGDHPNVGEIRGRAC